MKSDFLEKKKRDSTSSFFRDASPRHLFIASSSAMRWTDSAPSRTQRTWVAIWKSHKTDTKKNGISIGNRR